MHNINDIVQTGLQFSLDLINFNCGKNEYSLSNVINIFKMLENVYVTDNIDTSK